MNKTKPPVLTSPWKIGFLVSLFLVLGTIGVNLVLTRAFGISWNWLSFNQGHWVFRMDSFFNQMFPQIVVVFLLSLIAYFSVTSAVRKYKAYLDSGFDYRNLVQSLRGLGDLDDGEKIRKLQAYPELKQLLENLRQQISEREQELKRREEEIEAKQLDGKTGEQVRSESNILLKEIETALAEGRAVEPDVGISHPDLLKIARALSAMPTAGRKWGDEEKERMSNLYHDLHEAGEFLTTRLETISDELLESGEEAKDIERQLSILKQQVEIPSGEGIGDSQLDTIAEISNHLSVMEKLSESLAELGEETKSVAINTALQAGSGEGTLADLIQLAEGVKEIAEKFDQSARSYQSLTGEIKKSVESLEDEVKKGSPTPDFSSSVSSLSSKVSLWVERIVVLSDKIKTLMKSYDLSFKTMEEKISGYAEMALEEEKPIEPPEESFFELEKSEGFMSMARGSGGEKGTSFSTEEPQDAAEQAGEEPLLSKFESQEKSDESGRQTAQQDESEMSGIEKESSSLFEHTSDSVERPGSETAGPEPELEKKDQEDVFRNKPAPKRKEDLGAVRFGSLNGDINRNEDVPDPSPMEEPQEEAEVSPADQVSQGQEEINSRQEPRKQKIDAAFHRQAGMSDEEDGVIDLYALGAVDYIAHESE